MGRYATVPKVEDLGGYYWHITRVLDPDDEFAEKQVLSPEGWVPADGLDDYDVVSFNYEPEADAGLEVYLQGARDGMEAAVRAANAAFLGY